MNKPFKGLVNEYNEVGGGFMEDEDKIEDWTVGHHQIATPKAVGQAWEPWDEGIKE